MSPTLRSAGYFDEPTKGYVLTAKEFSQYLKNKTDISESFTLDWRADKISELRFYIHESNMEI